MREAVEGKEGAWRGMKREGKLVFVCIFRVAVAVAVTAAVVVADYM
jgi:hypothetical protein